MLLRRYKFDVIHINNGLHGSGYTEEQYRQGLETLVALLKEEAPQSTIIWCATTPIRNSNDLTQFAGDNPRAVERNRIATEIMTRHQIPVDDLYTLVADHPEYFSQDGVHYNDEGKAAQAKQVAAAVIKALSE